MEADFLAIGNSEYTACACPRLLFVYFHKNKTTKEPPDHVEATLTPGVTPGNPWAQFSIFLVVPLGGGSSAPGLFQGGPHQGDLPEKVRPSTPSIWASPGGHQLLRFSPPRWLPAFKGS